MRIRYDALLDLDEAAEALWKARGGLLAMTDEGLDQFRVGVLYALCRLEKVAMGAVDANERTEPEARERVH